MSSAIPEDDVILALMLTFILNAFTMSSCSNNFASPIAFAPRSDSLSSDRVPGFISAVGPPSVNKTAVSKE